MSVFTAMKRRLGYFPRRVWRCAWSRLRQQTLPATRGLLSCCAGFAIRSPKTLPPEIPADLDPGIAAAVEQSIRQAQDRFRSGTDMSPLAELAEKGVALRAFLAECGPGQSSTLHALSVYPRYFVQGKSFTDGKPG